MKMPWHKPHLEHEVVEFFDLSKSSKQFRLRGGRYGFLVDGDFKQGATVAVHRAGLIHDRPILVSHVHFRGGYEVLELTRGNYEVTVMGSAVVSVQLAVIHG